MLTRALLVGLSAALLVSTGSAAEPAAKGYAVIIGVSKYQDAAVTPRPNAERDATALYELLADKGHFPAGAERVKLLLGTPIKGRPGSEATRANILAAIEWLGKNATADDPVIFAFFGAGGTQGENAEIAYYASDNGPKGVAAGVTASEIRAVFDKLPSQQLTTFLDVNFKGRGDASTPDALADETPFSEFLGPSDKSTRESKPGRVVFLATNGRVAGTDLKDRGLFTDVLLAGLRGDADSYGSGKDGIVTIAELATWLDTEMPKARREKAKDARPTPHFILGQRNTRAVLTYEPKARAAVNEQLTQLAKLQKDSTLSEEEHRVGAEILKLMPRSEPLQTMRKEFVLLATGKITGEQFKTARNKLLEEMKLPKKAAEQFATSVLDAAENVAGRSVYEPKVPAMIPQALRGLCLALEEPVPEELARRLSKPEPLSETECRTLLIELRAHLGNRPDLANHKDVDIALQRMLAPIDPYTTYIDREAKQKFEIDTRGAFVGVGLQVRSDQDTGFVRVVTPIRNGPAMKLGIRAEDQIERITRVVDSDGKQLDKPEIIETRDLPLEVVVKKLLGKAGTKVTLTIRRGDETPFDVEVTRGGVKTESIYGFRRKDDASWDYMIDADKKIGYIRMSSFQAESAKDFAAAVKDLQEAGMTGLVLDLRFNPGGYLTTAVEIADLLIDDQEVVSIKVRGTSRSFKGHKEGSLTDFPIVCLINGYSASGSEILSACLQDHKRAIICGERSFGKGSVQTTEPYEGGLIKFTTARFYPPSGRNLDKRSTKGTEEEEWGVSPDSKFEVKLTRQERDDLAEAHRLVEIIGGKKPEKEFNDRQLKAALEHLRAKK